MEEYFLSRARELRESQEPETVTCRHCGDILYPGDTYYTHNGDPYCPNCMDAIVASHRHTVGETIDRI